MKITYWDQMLVISSASDEGAWHDMRREQDKRRGVGKQGRWCH